MRTSRESAALGRGTLFAKAACLAAMAASVASSAYAAAGSLRQPDGGKHELGVGGAVTNKNMAVVFPIAEVIPALGRIAAWSTACSDDFDLPMDLILYVEPNETQSHDFVNRATSRFALLDMTCFEDFNFVLAKHIYEVFTDDVVRQHFDEYEAIAVLDWKNIEVQKNSFARLYSEVFDRPRSRHWWVMAADAAPLEAREAGEPSEMFEKGLLLGNGGGGGDAHLVWSINSKAVVFNNRSRCLRRFFRFEMSPLLRDQPFDLALWATLSFTPPTNQPWGGILLRFVTVDGLIGSPSPAVWEGPDRPIFLDTSGIDWTDSLSASASDSTSSFFVDAAQEARNGGVLRHTRPNDHDHQQQQQQQQQEEDQQQQIREELMQASWELQLREEREERAGAAEAQEEQTLGELIQASSELERLEEEEEEEEEWIRAARAGARRDAALDHRTLTTLVGESWLPFTDTLRRGQVCAFIPAYAHQRAFAEATAESVLRFMPGLRVAVAVDPSELEDYQTYFGPLDGVRVTTSVDVDFSAVTADIRCGEGTELILYLEPGAVLSRPFTHADTHDTRTGDLLVMYTDPAGAGITRRQAAFASSADKLLEAPHPLPLFPVGTDLLLPASANRDLREIVGLFENRDADWEIRLVSLGRGCREPEVNVPQALASAAFLVHRPGAVFLGSPGREEHVVGVFEDEEIRQLVLKPRFGCQFFPEVYYSGEGTVPLIIGTKEGHFSEDELETAANSLRAQLALFVGRGESCASGLIRLLKDPDNSSAGLVGDREEDEPILYDDRSSSVASTTLMSDGERNGDYGREQQQGSNHPYGPSLYSTYLETAYDRTDDADEVAIASGRSYAGPSSLETGHDSDSYSSYLAKFLRSSRHAAAAADAAAAAAAREADDDDDGFSFDALGHGLEGYSSHKDGGDSVLSAFAAEAAVVAGGERASSEFFAAPEFADYHWPAGAEDVPESSGGGFAYYHAELSRFSEDAAPESARVAAYATKAAATPADVVDRSGGPSTDEATGGGGPQGVSHGVGLAALAKN